MLIIAPEDLGIADGMFRNQRSPCRLLGPLESRRDIWRANMANDKIYGMHFSKVFPLLIAKAERKGRTKEEVYEITEWLTGYNGDSIDDALASEMTYGEFFTNAPALNPDRRLIKGAICGIKVEEIEEPLMQEIRYLDKLVDELAKGKPLEKIKRQKCL